MTVISPAISMKSVLGGRLPLSHSWSPRLRGRMASPPNEEKLAGERRLSDSRRHTSSRCARAKARKFRSRVANPRSDDSYGQDE